MRNLYYLLKMARLTLPYKARKYITVLLFIMLGFFLFKSAFAVYDPNPKHSKWFHDSIVNDPLTKSAVEVKAQRTYPVTVTNPSTGAKDTITKVQRTVVKLGPPVANVGKKLLKGGAQVAVATAVYDILGKTVDWVMDAENNRIKYKDDVPTGSPNSPSNKYYWAKNRADVKRYLTPELACQDFVADPIKGTTYVRVETAGSSSKCYLVYTTGDHPSVGVPFLNQTFYRYDNPAYDPDVPPPSSDWQYIPIDTVAQKVIENADSGHAPSMEVMNNTALDMLEAGLLDAQLEAAADPKKFGANESNPLGGSSPTPDPETDPESPTDPDGESPDPAPEAEPFELPPFCAWATKVCDFIDWVQTPPSDPEDGAGDIEIEKPDPDMHVGILERLYINMPAECPPDPVLQFMGAKIPFPMSVFCQFASMMKPLILLFAYIKGLSIIGNGLT